MNITKTIYFHRGDVVEFESTLYMYLGNNVWMGKDTHTLYHGRNTVTVSGNRNVHLGLTYIAEGKVANTLFQGIPEINDILLKNEK